MSGEEAIFNLEIKKKSGLSLNPDIHHSKVFSSVLSLVKRKIHNFSFLSWVKRKIHNFSVLSLVKRQIPWLLTGCSQISGILNKYENILWICFRYPQ